MLPPLASAATGCVVSEEGRGPFPDDGHRDKGDGAIAFARVWGERFLSAWLTSVRHGCQSSARMTSFAVGLNDEPWGGEPTVARLVEEYAEYVREEHAICRGCPVVRSGVTIVRSMLEWKAIHRDGRLDRWTRRDIRDYLLHYLPTANVSRVMLPDGPTCAKDLVYFLADRGSVVGDDVAVLTEATDEVFYGYLRPADVVDSHSTRSAGAERRAKRKAAGLARKRNRRAR